MDAQIFTLTLAATFFAGFQVFANKVAAERGLDSALNSVFSNSLTTVVAGIGCVYFASMPMEWEKVLFWGFLNGLVYAAVNITRIDALRHIDSTIFFPINKIVGPFFVALSGVFILGENITPLQWLGIFGALLVPALLIERTEHARQKNLTKGLVLCVVSTLLAGLSVLFVKCGLAFANSFWFFVFVANLFCTVTAFVVYGQKKKWRMQTMTPTKHDIEVGIATGAIGVLSSLAFNAALQNGFASLVYTIHAHYILIPIFLSVWWYKEHINTRKFAAVVLSCVTLGLLYA